MINNTNEIIFSKLTTGLTDLEVETSRKSSGSNALTHIEQEPLWKKLLTGFKDPILMILIVALVIQVLFWLMGRGEWFEAVGIFVAIIIANLVGVLSENKQEGKASELRAEAQSKERTKVLRNGVLLELPINDVVVGDIVILQAGDKIPADGIVLSGKIKVDQATLNGETKETPKSELISTSDLGDIKDLLNPFYVYRGTVVCEGECSVEVHVVGDKTLYGELALEMQEDTRETPLKVKLNKLAGQISKFGYIGAGVVSLAYLFQNLVLAGNIPLDIIGWAQLFINAISLAVVIIVMAVPEGLPMMISLVLSMNMGKMMKDNVLVRKLNGIETAGGLNILFSDKTGTITEGKLSVTELVTGNVFRFNTLDDISFDLSLSIIAGIGINNSSVISNSKIIGGNSTDRALMSFLSDKTLSKSDVKEFNAFDSSKKYSSVVVHKDGKSKTYIKGAPEKILEQCTHYIDETGVKHELTDFSILTSYMNTQASKSMRLLGVAECDGESDTAALTLLCILSIRDNVRSTSIEAIKAVRDAGVQVVMVTGDRTETAVAIAKEAKLLGPNPLVMQDYYTGSLIGKEIDGVALTSACLNTMTDDEVKSIMGSIRVISRALPTDKSRMVRLCQEMNLVVGMTGDGVNDSPALKKADVGFAMGSGTEVAKEAGDITILDDNFLSIEKAILYGRTIFKNIRKFLIFQLTVNVSTVALCFLAPLLGISQPLSIITILYINLVMDTLAALAFGNEPALRRFMSEKPIKRDESILSKKMISQILVIGSYIVAVSLCILLLPQLISIYAPHFSDISVISVEYKESAMLAFLMLTVLLNGLFARTEGVNVFEHISDNKAFTVVMFAVLILLVLLIHVISTVATLTPISLVTWLVMGVLALGSIPIDIIRKLIVNKN